MDTGSWVSGKNILLVEDDQLVRQSIKLLLNLDRHTVTEASGGRQALELFAGSKYDLVITDYLMPEMLGDELAKNLKQLKPSQPVLMVTAYMEKLAEALKTADAVLAKPFALDDLRQAAACSLSAGFTGSAPAPQVSTRADVLEQALRAKPLVADPSSSPEPTRPAPELIPPDAREHIDSGTLALWVQEQVHDCVPRNSPAQLMLQLLTFAYACNVLASEDLLVACGNNPAFQSLCHGSPPFAEEIATFRRRHRPQLELTLARVLAKVVTPDAGQTSNWAWTKFLQIARQRLDIARHLDALN